MCMHIETKPPLTASQPLHRKWFVWLRSPWWRYHLLSVLLLQHVVLRASIWVCTCDGLFSWFSIQKLALCGFYNPQKHWDIKLLFPESKKQKRTGLLLFITVTWPEIGGTKKSTCHVQMVLSGMMCAVRSSYFRFITSFTLFSCWSEWVCSLLSAAYRSVWDVTSTLPVHTHASPFLP